MITFLLLASLIGLGATAILDVLGQVNGLGGIGAAIFAAIWIGLLVKGVIDGWSRRAH